MTTHYDAVVIGSGFGGAIPALRIAEAGKRVVVLERGYRIQDKDFRQDWSMRNLIRVYYPITSPDYTLYFRTANLVGGGSVVYDALCLRMPSDAFNFVDNTGYPIWPVEVNRQVLDPYYDIVEQTMQVRRAEWNEVPKSGGIFASLLNKMGLSCDRGRYPLINCRQCGFCDVGCMFGAKQHLGHNYIPQAESLGAEFWDGCKAREIFPSSGGYTVSYMDRYQNINEVEGEVVILAAGTPCTAEILLRSKQNHLLPELSDQVGQNFSNNGDFTLLFTFPEGLFGPFNVYEGRSNAGVISYAFWNEYKITMHTGSLPPGIFAGLQLGNMKTWGLDYKYFTKEYYPSRLIGVAVIGMVTGEGTVSLINDRAAVSIPMTNELLNYQQKVINIGGMIAKANNLQLFYWPVDQPYGDAHLLSSCRMGDDPKRSVTDAYGQIRGYPGLFITDGSVIPGGTGVNPALTIAANAERIGRYIAGVL